MCFNLIYWSPIGGCYFWLGSNLEKYGNFWKNGRFSGRIRPDWGNTARADMAGLGSIGLNVISRLDPILSEHLACSSQSVNRTDIYSREQLLSVHLKQEKNILDLLQRQM